MNRCIVRRGREDGSEDRCDLEHAHAGQHRFVSYTDTEESRAVKAERWARGRLAECEHTMKMSMDRRSRDFAYGESIVLREMIRILEGKS